MAIPSRSLILLNGPPSSGKDECAKHLYVKLNIHWLRMSQPLKDGLRAMFSMTEAEYADCEKHKDAPCALFMGRTFRDAQIELSEGYAKHSFGQDVFGKLALRKVQRSLSKLFVISDCGFAHEVAPLLQHFRKSEVMLVQLHRPGKTFDNDSRSYIKLDGIREIPLLNSGSLHALHNHIDTLVNGWLARDEA